MMAPIITPKGKPTDIPTPFAIQCDICQKKDVCDVKAAYAELCTEIRDNHTIKSACATFATCKVACKHFLGYDLTRSLETAKTEKTENTAMATYTLYFSKETSSSWDKNSEYNWSFVNNALIYWREKLQCGTVVFLNDIRQTLGMGITHEGQIFGWGGEDKSIDCRLVRHGDRIWMEFTCRPILDLLSYETMPAPIAAASLIHPGKKTLAVEWKECKK